MYLLEVDIYQIKISRQRRRYFLHTIVTALKESLDVGKRRWSFQ